MSIRTPNPRYLGDGIYARHDGATLWLETSDGLSVQNRIAVSGETLEAVGQYIRYAREYYETGQHLVGPGCEDCGRSLEMPESPIEGAVRGEVYRTRDQEDRYAEVRLCPDCAGVMDQDRLRALLDKRGAANRT